MTTTSKHERRRHFRGNARPGRRVDLRFRPAGGSAFHEAVTRNIGVGGAFVLYKTPLPVGTELLVEINVPTSDQVIQVHGEVRWILPAEEDVERAGMGVKFVRVDVDSLLLLSEYFASLTGVGSPAL